MSLFDLHDMSSFTGEHMDAKKGMLLLIHLQRLVILYLSFESANNQLA
jgi:hypothetical protein